MPACTAVKRICQVLLLLALPLSVQATSFSVETAQVYQIGNGYVLNAEIRYPLTPRVQEALDNGVPITFLQEIQLVRRTPILWNLWQWDTTIWSTEIRYVLRYHALSQQYMLQALNVQDHRNFPTLASALNALGKISNLSLPPKHTANREALLLRLRSGLDLNALPSPMRPGAMLSSKWDLTSSWYEALWPSD